MATISIPLFPLGTVLFPDGVLPLQIFEVRYLDMISRCLTEGEPFGVVLLTQGQGAFAARLLGTAEQLSRQWQVALSVPLQQRVAELKARLGPPASPAQVIQVGEPGSLLHSWSQGQY